MKIIKNGQVFCADGVFRKKDVAFDGETILAVSEPDTLSGGNTILDASGQYVCPGLVDIHIHGANGQDFSDGTEESINAIAGYLAGQGVTSFLGTTMAFGENTLKAIFETVKPMIGKAFPGRAVLQGINMEGPFFSKAKKGAQNEEFIIDPDVAMFDALQKASGNAIRLLDIAPELSGSIALITEASKSCRVSLAHTTADYDTAKKAFEAGASHVTHLFNAMPPLNHREPGVVGAAMEYANFVEIICDGIHLHPAIVRMIFRLFGRERVCIVSDSMRACGLPNGTYTLGGQTVTVHDGRCTLDDGTIAGSATNAAEGMRIAVKFGIPLEDALTAATITPARAAGISDTVGSLEKGKRADILILNKDLQPETVIVAGKF